MQETTNRVANMLDPSPEIKAKVLGFETLHKPEKTLEKIPLMHALVPGCRHAIQLNYCQQLLLQQRLIEGKSQWPIGTLINARVIIRTCCQ